MTDGQTSDLSDLLDELGNGLADVARTAWAQMKPVLGAVAGALATDPDDEAEDKLVIDVAPDPEAYLEAVAQMFKPRPHRRAARAALGALLDGDDQAAARHLDGLDAAQLYTLEAAASGLAIHASRLRRPMVDAEHDAVVLDLAQRNGHDIEIAPMDSAHGEGWHRATCEPCYWESRGLEDVVRSAAEDHAASTPQAEADELVVDVAPDPAAFAHAVELANAKKTADERVAFIERQRAAWEADARRHLENADYWRQRANRAEHEAAKQHDRAETAERKRDEFRSEMLRIGDLLGDACRRAEDRGRRLAEMRDRADRAEAEAKDWRTVAGRSDTTLGHLRTLADQLDYIRTEDLRRILDEATGEPPSLRTLVDQHPQMLRDFLRREVHNDPQWWRSVLRRELRLGHLAEDLRRAGLDPL